jgi:peptidoglycan/LPS O-acetylase OafA/YrhL
VNGSLWTLPYEMLIYGILAAAWVVPIPLSKYRLPIFKTTIVALAIVMGALDIAGHFADLSLGPTPRLLFMFFTAATFYVFKEKIALSRAVFWICIVALAVSLLRTDVYFIVYRLTLAYCLLYIAFVPGGFIREYNKLGDFSYGTYIYAFPIQQTIASLIPGISIPMMFVTSTIVTIPLAVASWHLIEKRALSLKDYSVHFTRQFLHSSY